MKSKIQNPKFKIILLFTIYCLLFTTLGCEAFVRKFTRKKKKEKLPREEMVLVPEEYQGPAMTEEQLYRQYFLFWKSWQDELITALSMEMSPNHKKQIDCVSEAIKNLTNLRVFLVEGRQKKLDVYIGQLEDLKQSMSKDLYSKNMAEHRRQAERTKRNILRDFSYDKVKQDVIYSTEFSETY